MSDGGDTLLSGERLGQCRVQISWSVVALPRSETEGYFLPGDAVVPYLLLDVQCVHSSHSPCHRYPPLLSSKGPSPYTSGDSAPESVPLDQGPFLHQ